MGQIQLEERVECLEAESSERWRWRTMHKFFPLEPLLPGSEEYRFRVTVEKELPGTVLQSGCPSLDVYIAYSLRVASPLTSSIDERSALMWKRQSFRLCLLILRRSRTN